MDGKKLSGVLYLSAGIMFCISGFIGGNILALPIGAVCVILGLRKLKEEE